MKECENIKDRELIDNYIQGILPETDKEAFEQHYFECDRCFQELQAREKLIEIIRERGETVFAEYIAKRTPIRDSFRGKLLGRLFPKAPIWRQGWVYAIATAIVVLILLPVLSTLFESNTYKDLADVKPYPYLLAGLRSGANQGEQLFSEGMRFYTEGEYHQAAGLLEKAVAADPDHALAHFFLGICLLVEDNTARAIASLERATAAHPDSEIFQWYLGQAFLKRGDGERALKAFEIVRDLNGDYRTEAEALIRKIEELGR